VALSFLYLAFLRTCGYRECHPGDLRRGGCQKPHPSSSPGDFGAPGVKTEAGQNAQLAESTLNEDSPGQTVRMDIFGTHRFTSGSVEHPPPRSSHSPRYRSGLRFQPIGLCRR
jgi:hypothetical protein